MILAWILSYIAVLLIAEALSLVTTTRLVSRLRDEITGAEKSLLYQTRETTDTRLLELRKLAGFINSNKYVNELIRDKDGSFNALDYNYLMIELRGYQASNSFIGGIYILPENKNEIVALSSVRSDRYKDQLLSRYAGADGTPLSEILAEPHYGSFVPLEETGSGGVKKDIALLQSLPAGNMRRRYGLLMIVMDASSIFGSRREFAADTSAYVLDGDGAVVAANTQMPLPEEIRYETVPENDVLSGIETEKGRCMALAAGSTVTDWKYVFLIPEDAITGEVRAAWRSFWTVTATGLLFGVLLAVFLARQQYSPLRTLVEDVEHRSEIPFEGENEYQFVRAALDKTIDRSAQETIRYRQQMTRIRESLLERMVSGTLDTDVPAAALLDTYGISFPYRYFTVLLLGSVPAREEEGIDEAGWFLITDIFESLFSGEGQKACGVRAGGRLAVIVNRNDPETDLSAAAGRAMEMVLGERDTELVVTEGTTEEGAGRVSTSFAAALAAMQYCEAEGLSGFYRYADLTDEIGKTLRARNYVSEAKAYADAHFRETGLSIAEIAEHIGLSTSYLSKQYKQGTGEGLLDYIQKKRIACAKELLSGSGDPIADVARQSGFVSSNSLIRVFKQYEGMTPGKYRDIYKEEVNP